MGSDVPEAADVPAPAAQPAEPVRFATFCPAPPRTGEEWAAEVLESDRQFSVWPDLQDQLQRAWLASRIKIFGTSFDLDGTLTNVQIRVPGGTTPQDDVRTLETILDGIPYQVEIQQEAGHPPMY